VILLYDHFFINSGYYYLRLHQTFLKHCSLGVEIFSKGRNLVKRGAGAEKSGIFVVWVGDVRTFQEYALIWRLFVGLVDEMQRLFRDMHGFVRDMSGFVRDLG
jgi:hypothetical protein